MRNGYVAFVLLLFTFYCAELPAYGDEPAPAPTSSVPAVKDIPPGADKIVGVNAGDKAPFTGQLFDPPTALRWANWLQQYRLRLETDVELAKRTCQADVNLGAAKLSIEQEKNTTITADLRKTLADQNARIVDLQKSVDSPPFFRTVWFGAILGVVATGVLFGLGVYAASAH